MSETASDSPETPKIEPPEVTYPVYDNMPPGPGSHHPQNVQHHWRVRIGEVDQAERDRRWVKEPMEQIIANCGSYAPISHEESLDLAERYRAGDMEAKELLILHFQRFVVWHAKQAFGQSKRLRMPMEDMVQDGITGLIRSVETTDPEKSRHKKGAMASYFGWGIRKGIQRGLADKSRMIRLPVHIQSKARNLVWVSSTLRNELDREPTTYEIAERAGMVPPKPQELMGLGDPGQYDEFTGRLPERVINRARIGHAAGIEEAIKEVEQIMRAERPVIPLDGYICDRFGDMRPLHEVAEDTEGAQEFEDEIYVEMLRGNLDEALRGLSYRERRILELRYGFDDDYPRTFDEVAKVFNVTRERIRQIENQSLKKLQVHSRLHSQEVELTCVPSRATPQRRTYIDHVSDVVSRANGRGQTPCYSLGQEAMELERQRQQHLRQEAAKRRHEQAVDNAGVNLEKIAEDYLSRSRGSSLHVDTSKEEQDFAVDYQAGYEDKIAGIRLRQQALRKYGGLAAFMALSLKPEDMSPVEAWEVARGTLFRVLRNYKTGGPRLADQYAEAAEKAFEHFAPVPSTSPEQ